MGKQRKKPRQQDDNRPKSPNRVEWEYRVRELVKAGILPPTTLDPAAPRRY